MKKAIIALIIGVIVIGLVGNVSAEIEVTSPTFFEKILNLLRTSQFTIVGQDNHADVLPHYISGMSGTQEDYYFKVQQGTSFYKSTSTTRNYCGGNSGLWNVFASDTPNSGIGIPRFEMIDEVEFRCSSAECQVQLYCMPYVYPPTESSCDSWGATKGYSAGQVSLDTKSAVDSYMPLKDIDGNSLSSYKYCKVICTGEPITCWRIEGSSCSSRTYDCSYETYPNCPDTYPYNSESECKGNIEEEEEK